MGVEPSPLATASQAGASSNAHGLGTMVMQFEYHDGTGSRVPLYDRVGNRLAEYKAHQPSRSEQYLYDSASRLADPGYVAATSSSNKSFERGTLVSNRSAVNSGASPYEREGWRLDGVNNWNQYGSNTGGASIGTSIESTAFNEWVLGGGPTYAGYDDNGNAEIYNHVAGASPGIYRWDPWNRLREIDDQYSQKVAEYLYDAHNRRVRKVVAYGGVENSGDVRDGTTDYAYQGWRVLWENFTPEVMPFAPTGGPTTFVYGSYLDEVWNAMEIDGAEIIENYYFLTGVNYSVMGVIDALTGGNTLAEAYEYDPYGRHRVIDPGTDATYFTSDDTYDELHPGAINNAIRYTGQRFDAESGLMYYKNRYYDPSAGRFIGRDPLGWEAGANLYGYVGGMPTMAVDPEGLLTVTETRCDEGGANSADVYSTTSKSWNAKKEIEAIRDALNCFQCSGWAEDEDREYMKSMWRVIGEYERINYGVNISRYESINSINYSGFYNPATGSISLYLLDRDFIEKGRQVEDNGRCIVTTIEYEMDKGATKDLYELLVHEGMHAVQARRPNGLDRMAGDLATYGYNNAPHEIEADNVGTWLRYIALPCTTNEEYPRPLRSLFKRNLRRHYPDVQYKIRFPSHMPMLSGDVYIP
jgi:RHS repeat-associated protein